MLVARTVSKEDVVKEQLLHHWRHHAVHLRSRLVDQHFSQSSNFRCHVDHARSLSMWAIIF